MLLGGGDAEEGDDVAPGVGAGGELPGAGGGQRGAGEGAGDGGGAGTGELCGAVKCGAILSSIGSVIENAVASSLCIYLSVLAHY